MKKVMAFLITLALSCSAAYAATSLQHCADATGTWIGTRNICGGPSICAVTYTIPASVNGSFSSGTIQYTSTGGPCTYNITGSYVPSGHGTGNAGNFHYTATRIAGNTGCVELDGYTSTGLSISGAGCQGLVDNFGPLVKATRNSCEVPGTDGNNGEHLSVFKSWLPSSGTAAFSATLNDINDHEFQFAGRTVQEVLGTTSGCGQPSVTPYHSGDWYPDLTYNYSVGNPDDQVGLSELNGDVYLEQVRRNLKVALPCTVVFQQAMQIDCDGGNGTTTWHTYESHSDVITIDDKTVKITRNTTPSTTIVYGLSRSQWRAVYHDVAHQID